MTIGRCGLQNGFGIVGNVQENAVEIITRFFGRNRKARFIDDLNQRACRDFKRGRQVTFGNRRKIFTWKGRERETSAASIHGHATIGGVQLHLRTIGQLAGDFEQCVRGNGCCAGGFDIGSKSFNDLQIKVSRGQLDFAAFACFDKDIGQYRNGVAPFHHGLDVAQAFQQRRAFDRGSHSHSPCRAGWSASQPKNPVNIPNLP